MPLVSIKPEFIYQHKMYRACKYAKEIKHVLNNKEKIRNILNRYKDKESLSEDWWPIGVYCEKCRTDNTKILNYNNEYEISYECDCGFSNKIDFRKKGIVKLSWRVDWPMRWKYEKVDFEPGGKDHSTVGGSYDTGKLIIKELYNEEAPLYVMYDFITIKGAGGKISSSLGNVITLSEALEVYEPEVIRFLFAGTRPNTEFAISFDLDVVKIYEDFDRLEERYYNDQIDERDKRIYELSCIKVGNRKPERIGFRHLTMLVQIYDDVKKISKEKEILERARCAKNWIEKYAPEEFKFKVHEKISKEILKLLNKKQKESLKLLQKSLEKKRLNEQELFDEFYEICKKVEINNAEFFKGAYLALIGKERGPRLAGFILAIGKEKVLRLLKEIK